MPDEFINDWSYDFGDHVSVYKWYNCIIRGDVLKQIASYLLVFFALVWLIVFILHVRHVNQRMKTIEKIIKDIIYRELKTHEDILKQCEGAGIFKHKKD